MSLSMKLKDRYEVKEVLARGGMGVVYKALDKLMNRQVAVKTLLDITDKTALKLFYKECEDLASMVHPNIVQIYDIGQFEENGVTKPYLVMPLLRGVTLEKLISTSSQRLSVERTIDIICQACRGLQAAHDRGLVHRDIKPSNIFVLEDDSVQIIDFGVAHRVETSRTVGRKGTLLYMAPEQLEMKPLSAVSDIFSLGAVCYETLTRRRPFERTTEDSTVDAILHSIPVPASEFNPSVSPALSQAIHKAIAKQPWHRYSNAREFGETLQRALRNEPIEIFNPVRIRPRLERAAEAYEKADFQFSEEIIGELEAEGHLNPAITDLRRRIDEAVRRKTIEQLLDTTRTRMDEQEYPLALQRVHEILQLDPNHTDALALKNKIENRRADGDISEWFRLARQHMDGFAYGHAREALQRILQLRPKEGRALQLLSEVDRLEKEYLRLRQEKEQLYQAAVEASKRGDISSALSKLERVLELDRRAPDVIAQGRGATYQNLYNEVRSEHEAVKSAYAEAKRQLETTNFSAALAICEAQLAKYPRQALFQALQIDIEEQHRQAISARIADTDRKVEGEADLNRRVSIIEDAVEENPGEAHFEHLLQRTRDKRDLVESIVARARGHEQQAQFGDALSQWEILQTIYTRYPGLNLEIERLIRRRDQHVRSEAKNRWVDRIDRLLEIRDYHSALASLAKAQEEFPGAAELAELEKLARRGVELVTEAQQLLADGQQKCAEQRYEDGIETLRHACELDDQNSAIRSVLLDTLVERALALIDQDPAAAEQFLRQALELEPTHALAKGLLSLLEDRRRQQFIDQCGAHARQLHLAGDIRGALRVVEQGLSAYPIEPRLTQLQSSLKKGLQEVRRKDLEETRRIGREIENVPDPPVVKTYSERLENIARQYTDDEEFKEVAGSIRRRLETAVQASPAETRPEETTEVLPRKALLAKGVQRALRRVRVEFQARWRIWGVAAPPVVEECKQLAGNVRRRLETVVQVPPAQTAPEERDEVLPLREPLARRLQRARRRVRVEFRTGWRLWGVATLPIVLVIGILGFADAHKRRAAPVPMVPKEGVVEITTSPVGAAIWVNGKESGTSGSLLRLKLPPGKVQIEARLPGYRAEGTEIPYLKSGSYIPVLLTLTPVLTLAIQCSGDARVAINEEQPVQVLKEAFVREVSVGHYLVTLLTEPSGKLTFSFDVVPDGLAKVTKTPSSRDVAVLLISNFGDKARIYSGGPLVKVQLDGLAVGDLGPGGLDLPKLSAANHILELGEDKNLRKKVIEIGQARTLTVIVDSDPNTGTLVVGTNEDGVGIVISANGKQVQSGETRNGQFRKTLRAGKYTIRAAKGGFEAITAEEQSAEIRKGQDMAISFEFRRLPVLISVEIRSNPGADMIVDNGPAIKVRADGTYVTNLPPGRHTVRAQMKGFRPSPETILDLVEGKAPGRIDLGLRLAVGTVEVKRSPTDSYVTYTRSGQSAPHRFEGTRQELEEGEYTFSAEADGYEALTIEQRRVTAETPLKLDLSQIPKKAPVAAPVPVTMADWGENLWTRPSGDELYVKRGGGYVLFPRALGLGALEFSIYWKGGARFGRKGSAQWVLNYSDEKNHLLCELDEEGLQVSQVSSGKKTKLSPKKFPVDRTLSTTGRYAIRIEIDATKIAHKVRKGSEWEILGTVSQGGFAQGKFGFLIPNGEELYLTNFGFQRAP